MLKEEEIVREIFAMWVSGLEGCVASFEKHCHPDLLWWNSARGGIEGRDICVQGLYAMQEMTQFTTTKVAIKNIQAKPGQVMVERSDDMYDKDGNLIAAVPAVGVLDFDGDKIISWRDYCNDWTQDLMPDA